MYGWCVCTRMSSLSVVVVRSVASTGSDWVVGDVVCAGVVIWLCTGCCFSKVVGSGAGVGTGEMIGAGVGRGKGIVAGV